MEASYNRQEHLKQLHSKRREDSRRKAESAIMRLARAGRSVNFNSVSEESGLSKATLYNNPDIRQSIEQMRFRQSQVPTPAQVKLEMSQASKDAVIASLKRKIETLTEKNKELERLLKTSYAEYYQKL